jgi:hypothetical protein
MITDGISVIAELPFEHTVMYRNYGRLGIIIKRGASCECCLKEAKHFVLVQRNTKHKTFALFTEDWVELTKDHIVPKYLGGKNVSSNYQVLCMYCNKIKGCSNMNIQELRSYIAQVYKSVVEFTKPIDLLEQV